MKITGEEISEYKAEQIVQNVSREGSDGIIMRDFLISCINYRDRDSMINYLRNAYNAFFDNEYESIDTQEIIDQFCSEKDIDYQFVKKIMHEIDKDHSNTISAAEFIQNIVSLLGTGITDIDVISELKYPSE